MKVLIVSAYFPPGNSIGAVRVGKLAKYLIDHGIDVRVISAQDLSLSQTLPLEIDSGRVQSTKWIDLHALPQKFFFSSNLNNGIEVRNHNRTFMKWGYNLFRSLFHWPDRHIGWFFPARKAGRRLIAQWKPDVIYASAWPLTSLLIAASLSKQFSIPWIAELRDLWLDNHYNHSPIWRRWIDRIIERKVLTSASLLVTVSRPLAEILKKFSKPTAVILNGFDEADFSKQSGTSQEKNILTITYTGMIYPGRRNPAPLFEALRQMGPLASRIRVRFIGRTLPGITDQIRFYGLSDCVEVYAPVSYKEALKYQSESDLLLLLMWDTPEEQGVFTGKLFEYLGSRRPILSIGLENGVAADLIRERCAGVVSNSALVIANALKHWLAEKDLKGQIDPLPESTSAGLSRANQFDLLLPMIKSVVLESVRRQKVLIVTRKIDIGGAERHLVQILPYLTKTFEISVFTIYRGSVLEQELQDSGIEVHSSYYSPWKWLIRPLRVLQLAFIMRSNRNSIVHFFLPEAYLLGALSGIAVGHSKMVMSRRSLNIYQQDYPALALLEKKLHPRMRIILGNSRAVLSDLIEEGVPVSRTRLIYNGVDVHPLPNGEEQNSLRTQHGIMADDLVIVVVANLFRYKGHMDLIHAMGLIAPKLVMPWRLLLIGRDEGEKSKLQLLLQLLGLSEHISFLDEVKKIDSLLQIADISVLPSHQEGFSNAILESMAAGLPVVVTNVGGNPEAVLHEVTGLVVPSHSPYELGQAIFSLACDPEKRKAYGDMARKRVQEHFSVEACVAAYNSLYQALGDESQCHD